MSQARVESVDDDSVVVANDDDGILGELLRALLAEPDDARLHTLLRGTLETTRISPVLVAERVRSGPQPPPVWLLRSRTDNTTTISADDLERLYDQACQLRREAREASFPLGQTLANRRYSIVEHLHGSPDRGMYRARERGSGNHVLVTLGPPQQIDSDTLRTRLALAASGIAPLVHIGRLESLTEARFEGMVEAEPAGKPASDVLALPVDPGLAVRIALAITKPLAAAHATAAVVRGLRPELVYLEGDPSAPVLAGIAPRCEAFLTTAEPRGYGVPPCFDHFYQAPEVLARPFDAPSPRADVFSLCAVLAHWVSGEPPFQGEGAMQAIAIATGQRRRWRGPAALGAILDAGLHPLPEQRTSLSELVTSLARLEPGAIALLPG
jgi:hypothetical protein